MSQDFLANYKAKHQHPLNRLSHSIGIPLIVISLPLFFFNWRLALALFIAVGGLVLLRSRQQGAHRPTQASERRM